MMEGNNEHGLIKDWMIGKKKESEIRIVGLEKTLRVSSATV